MCGKGGLVPIEFVCCRELDDEVSADLGEDVRIHQLEIITRIARMLRLFDFTPCTYHGLLSYRKK